MRNLITATGLVFVCAGTFGFVKGSFEPLAAQQAGHARYDLAPAGNQAKYRVREQLAGVSFPNDAVGVTSAITGGVVLDANGKVVPELSRFTVNITGLKSDQSRRDGYIQNAVLQTRQFPTVELAIKELRGLTYPLAKSGTQMFELLGDLTVRGVTRPSVWQVTATPEGSGLTGTATTSFKFGDFGMERPRVAMVLSVDDKITLEYSFNLNLKSEI